MQLGHSGMRRLAQIWNPENCRARFRAAAPPNDGVLLEHPSPILIGRAE